MARRMSPTVPRLPADNAKVKNFARLTQANKINSLPDTEIRWKCPLRAGGAWQTPFNPDVRSCLRIAKAAVAFLGHDRTLHPTPALGRQGPTTRQKSMPASVSRLLQTPVITIRHSSMLDKVSPLQRSKCRLMCRRISRSGRIFPATENGHIPPFHVAERGSTRHWRTVQWPVVRCADRQHAGNSARWMKSNIAVGEVS